MSERGNRIPTWEAEQYAKAMGVDVTKTGPNVEYYKASEVHVTRVDNLDALVSGHPKVAEE